MRVSVRRREGGERCRSRTTLVVAVAVVVVLLRVLLLSVLWLLHVPAVDGVPDDLEAGGRRLEVDGAAVRAGLVLPARVEVAVLGTINHKRTIIIQTKPTMIMSRIPYRKKKKCAAAVLLYSRMSTCADVMPTLFKKKISSLIKIVNWLG